MLHSENKMDYIFCIKFKVNLMHWSLIQRFLSVSFFKLLSDSVNLSPLTFALYKSYNPPPPPTPPSPSTHSHPKVCRLALPHTWITPTWAIPTLTTPTWTTTSTEPTSPYLNHPLSRKCQQPLPEPLPELNQPLPTWTNPPAELSPSH